MQLDDGLPLVLRALDDVESADRTLRGAAQVRWTSDAADRFRAALDEAEVRVRLVRTAVERAVQPVAAADVDAGRGSCERQRDGLVHAGTGWRVVPGRRSPTWRS